jgi:aconitate hydratase
MSAADHAAVRQGDLLELDGIHAAIEGRRPVLMRNVTRDRSYMLSHGLSSRQVRMLLAGGLTRFLRFKWGRAG